MNSAEASGDTASAEARSLAALAQSLQPADGGLALAGASGWMQGRTMYGGASSFLAYSAARALLPGLPPLRGAQVTFVAPVGESLQAQARLLRRGRSVTQVETDLTCGGELVHRTIWLFGEGRADNGIVPADAFEELTPPDECAEVAFGAHTPAFTARFEVRHAGPREESRPATIRRWVRLRERDGLDPMAELVAVGDMLPPGAMRAMERLGPISSINWAFTVLGEAPGTRDGWWLLETSSNQMAGGFSSETLRLWNADGIEMMRGLQSVAVFG
ncbi:thioesterase family protein [Novosphingobium cyanobacteriorum]|uniref:Thioesterase family protein n=1 Tax=Novosphingobium cyanobacteriorum TaxID=3024215 RepID=A0ABT6CE20_9SPHN|nr:thioesterase family protein [Novosphingobium cyanobacteriorum]MDF8332169.1 thioesterase family protein [Novosphingobium cyanobacteriorum]